MLIAIGLVIMALIVGGGWYVKAVNQGHPAPWPMVQGDALGRFATKAVFPSEANLLWSYPLEETGFAFPVIGSDGTIYVHTPTQVQAVSPDGARRWRWQSSHGPGWLALSRQDDVYALGLRQLVALDQEGRTKWRFELGHEAAYPPVVGQGGVIYVATSQELKAISSDGQARWAFPYDHPMTWPIETREGLVIIGVGDRLYALHADGTEAWNLRLGYPDSPTALTGGEDGLIYFRVANQLHVIDKAGHVKLGFTNQRQMGWNMAASNGVIQSGRVRWTEDGEQLWDLGWIGQAGYTYLDAKGQALFAAQASAGGSIMLSLWGADGTKLWSLDQFQAQGPPAIGKDGRICFPGAARAQRLQLVCIGDPAP